VVIEAARSDARLPVAATLLLATALFFHPGARAADAAFAAAAESSPSRELDDTDSLAQVTVAEALMELRTGPGRGYPIYYVAERGETVTVLKRRTSWFKVRTARGKDGWVGIEQMRAAVMADGVSASLRDAVLADFETQTLDVGFAAGYFDGDPIVSFRAGYHFIEGLVAELSLSQISGAYSGSQLLFGSLQVEHPIGARFAPFLGIGGGYFRNRNRATLVGEIDSMSSTMLGARAGMRVYLTRNFLVRADYSRYLALTSEDQNDRFDEVQLGFSFFF